MERLLKASEYLARSGEPIRFNRGRVSPAVATGEFTALAQISQKIQEDACEITDSINNWRKDSIVLNQLCEVLSDAVIRVDSRGYVFEFNESACKLFVTTPAYMLGKTISELLYTDWDTFLSHYEEPAFEHMVHCLDGTSIIVSTSITHVSDGEHILVIRDISQRVKSDQDIRMLSAALNQASDVIIITNKLNKVIFVNKAFAEHTGYTEEEIMGKDPKFLHSGLTPPDVYKSMWSTLQAKHPWEGTVVNKRKDGTLISDYMMVTPVMNGDPVNPAFYIAIKRKEWSKPYEATKSGDSKA